MDMSDSGHSHDHRHGHGGHDHGGGHGPGGGDVPRDRHGNPEDFARYLAKLDDPERVAWQKPDAVVAAMGLRPGDVAADVGVGPGYFALRIARAVGPSGRVHAIDVDRRMLDLVVARAAEAGLSNVVPLLAEGDEVAVPPEPCAAILTVNAFHHFPDRPGALRRLASRLADRGHLFVVDFHGGELPLGPPPEHRVAREQALADVAAAGLAVAREETFLPYQYFLVLRAA
jgi:ubiquinone/menaquinone biosynthesis C-methylase UbiE